ncbi:phosphoglycerate dehydrogenase [Saccharopolyspora sp. WRP15-2]|uniref:Phosphoglycerate dehydrogenase n=1 Tax=Saccharopolyspora oryzae TaxID=2997343 RepID=A0ABT4V4Y0_9PSEU|nr:phosphoglycerate dehydrogenase [Saccharopolyspora oryzae]MDA3629005.1 phosphoglycerate dehydrogenase [Saccharopolyspora oryzae]
MSGRILVTPRSLTAAGLDAVPELAPLAEAGYELVPGPAGKLPSEEDLLALVPDCAGWLAGVERITDRVLDAAPELKVISRNGAGTDGIDLDAATARGVRVERAVGANAQGVAELAIVLAMSALRHVPWSAASVHEGGWNRYQGRELADVTVGVFGLGEIGRRVAGAFRALGADVVAHDPFSSFEGAEQVEPAELVRRSDVITLHCPPPPDGKPLITADLLARAPRGAVLINTARSALVDDAAVLAALDDGGLTAYAVDAFDTEPPELTPLLRHERVIATPHVGGYTGASVRRATAGAVANLLSVLKGGAA